MRISMELKQSTYKGVNLDTLEVDVIKLDRELNWFVDHSSIEHLEAVAEALREKYKRVFEWEDDGTLPDVVSALFSALQLYDKMRR